MIGERGTGLSAGERQRVALARAFLRHAPLLLLDEPTANLDGDTEAGILEAIRRLCHDRTALLVAHRPALLSVADRVVELCPPGSRRDPGWRSAAGCPTGPARTRQPVTRQAGRLCASTVGLVRPAGRRLDSPIALGAGAAGSGVALLATSAWLISRAAQRPSVVALGLAIIGVRFFAISRAIWRYAERLVGHDTALRVLADLRVRVYERLERLAPAGLPAFRSGDLLARLVQDVDAVQDLFLRVIAPWGVALLVGVPTVALFWYFLPAAGLVVGLGLLAAGTVVPWLSRLLAERREARQAAARGELSSGVVDLIEGAPELVAFGATETELPASRRVDAELTGIATATARTSRHRHGPHHPAHRPDGVGQCCWSASRPCSCRPPARTAAGGHRPHAPGALRDGRRLARRGPVPGTGPPLARPGSWR